MFINSHNMNFKTGRLVNDPIVNIDGQGNTIVNFQLVVGLPYLKDGKQATTLVSCKAFSHGTNKIADNIAKMTTKGSLVEIVGYDETQKYSKDGQDYYQQFIHVTQFNSMETKAKTMERRTNEN
ncbi:TPA: single-stranded DNA-binding protein [Streptococcus suis]|nr:single-stranded DNA-binding protein [Streptococcus suis]HEM4142589.1 single-stranded DNA-binding protein [Streptococcus suis]HEP1788335.1 single-stranded DNA-binding protein [Streptococcus suis]